MIARDAAIGIGISRAGNAARDEGGGCSSRMQIKLIVSLTLCWLMSSACDSNFGSKTSGQACTRSTQCGKGLTCLEGLCHSKRRPPAPDAPDAGEPDAEVTADAGERPSDVEK